MSDRTPEQRAADRREIEKLHPGERFQMMMDASDTPETDEQVFIATPESEDLESMDVVTADFARRLERERDDARPEAASFKEKEMGAVVIMSAEHRDYLEGIESERDQLRAQVCEVIEQGNECVSAVQGIPALEPLTFSTAMEAIRAEIDLGREKHREAQLEIHQLRARVAELEVALGEMTKSRDTVLQRLMEKVK